MEENPAPAQQPKGCCILHVKARNRAERRAADKSCAVKRAERKQ
ncbi:hypothetical protein AB0J81_13780 [Streptomyces bobili]